MDSDLPNKLVLFACMKSPLKMINNGFYLILKALFVLKMFKFLSWLFLPHRSKRLDKKTMIDFSRSKGNQNRKTGQLLEYNMTNNFLKKSYQKCGREISSRPIFVFSKSFMWGESKWATASFQYLLVVLNLNIQ